MFQTLSSIIKKHAAQQVADDWTQVKYKIFDSPSYSQIFGDGRINITNLDKTLEGAAEWCHRRGGVSKEYNMYAFESVFLNLLSTCNVASVHEQEELSYSTDAAMARIYDKLDEVQSLGGEGLILRDPSQIWIPERTHNLTKVKPFSDGTAVVTGYITGQKTNKGSKLLGKMGALITEFNGKRLELSGFTDDERELITTKKCDDDDKRADAIYWARRNPKMKCPEHIIALHFPVGSTVNIRYRELSDDGIPKEARYNRDA
jgi:hypothetical protein